MSSFLGGNDMAGIFTLAPGSWVRISWWWDGDTGPQESHGYAVIPSIPVDLNRVVTLNNAIQKYGPNPGLGSFSVDISCEDASGGGDLGYFMIVIGVLE